jgi:hypothetical protein
MAEEKVAAIAVWERPTTMQVNVVKWKGVGRQR